MNCCDHSIPSTGNPLWDAIIAAGYTPRQYCGPWPSWAIVIYIAAAVWICISYYRLPLSFLSLLKGKASPFSWPIVVLFVAFIGLCGTGHLIEDVGSFFWPNYPAFALWHGTTAVVSHIAATEFGRFSKQLTKQRREAIERQEATEQIAEEMDHGDLAMRTMAERLRKANQ